MIKNQSHTQLSHIKANWPASTNVHALTTTRLHGESLAPYHSMNLGLHVGDCKEQVMKNRNQLKTQFSLAREPEWLTQTHSTLCVLVEEDPNRTADAAVTRLANYPLVVMTADCLPITFCNGQGNEIAAIHAGWRGLVNGIIENTLSSMHSNKTSLLAWIGPAICGNCFEVGVDVYSAFINKYPFTEQAFKIHTKNTWLADFQGLAKSILHHLGVTQVYESKACTFEENELYYSYRKQPQTGRMATLIWFTD